MVQFARDNIRYWCNHNQNKRKKVFTLGGEGDYEGSNYVPPDLVMLQCDEIAKQKGNDGRWIENVEHFSCEELIKQITNDNINLVPANYLIEVRVFRICCVLKTILGTCRDRKISIITLYFVALGRRKKCFNE
jgi:hypothetical protein